MKFENTDVFNWAGALRGMRNPLESHDKSDSYDSIHSILGKEDFDEAKKCGVIPKEAVYTICDEEGTSFIIGKNDLKLAQNLIKAGGEHRKFLRMIHVCVDVDMPRYWWSEADTYHFNTKNSTSTIHKLLNNDREITKDLFLYCEEDLDVVNIVVDRLEQLRIKFKSLGNVSDDDVLERNKLLVRAKRLLMEGFLQMRTWDTNYEEIRNMWFQRVRHPHKLKEEWVETFGEWVLALPYSKELILFE